MPRSLFVHDAERTSSSPISGGGFADVYKGKLHGNPIALKVLRIFGSELRQASLHQV